MKTSTCSAATSAAMLLLACIVLTSLAPPALATPPAELSATWYGPMVAQGHAQQKPPPLVVVLASKNFPARANDFWVSTPWKLNFATLVLQCKTDAWKSVGVAQIEQQLTRKPANVPAEVNKLVLVCDQASASLAMRFMDGHPDRLAGIVLISVVPLELTRNGLGLWSPREACWAVPIWAVVGTNPADAAKALQMWRKLASYAPAQASLTVDARPGQASGYLHPDGAILDWLEAIRAGKRPAPGPDRQALAEQRRMGTIAKHIATAAGDSSCIAQPGETISKTAGPLSISLTAPVGWSRDRSAERAYNPKGLAADQAGLPLKPRKNPYCEIYITPAKRGPLFARARVRRWTGSGEDLLRDYNLSLARAEYFQVSLARWQQGPWAFEISSIMQPGQDKWRRWLTLAAAKGPAKGSGKTNPAGTLILLMDATSQTNPKTLAETMNQLRKSTKANRQVGK